MAILAECPVCRKKQAVRNRLCSGKSGCGEDLVKAKRSKKVRYWIQYRIPGGKQRKEFVGYSVEDARAADGKRKAQKKENRIFEMLPEAKMTFSQLSEWYLNLKSVKKLSSYDRVQGCIARFNEIFGNWIVGSIKPVNLEDYQDKREAKGLAPATIDMELNIVKTMVTKAFDNDMIDGRTLKAFRKVKNRLKKGANARDRELTIEEYLKLTKGKYTAKWKLRGKTKQKVKDVSPPHLKPILVVAFHTGMRRGELLGLKWSHIDREKGLIRLPADTTKEKKGKTIPINHHVEKVLSTLPRALHHDYVFTYKGQPIGNLKRSFKSACVNAGILHGQKIDGGLRFHDIRTTFKTNLLRAGVDKALRDTIVGHSLQGMDAYYLKPSDEDLKEAMDKYTLWIDNQFATVTQNITQKTKRG